MKTCCFTEHRNLGEKPEKELNPSYRDSALCDVFLYQYFNDLI